VAGRVRRTVVVQPHPDRADRRAGRDQPVPHGLRALPVRVRMRHHAVRELGRRRAVVRTEADRTARHGGRVRVRVRDALDVRARGWPQGTAADAPTETVHVANGRTER